MPIDISLHGSTILTPMQQMMERGRIAMLSSHLKITLPQNYREHLPLEKKVQITVQPEYSWSFLCKNAIEKATELLPIYDNSTKIEKSQLKMRPWCFRSNLNRNNYHLLQFSDSPIAIYTHSDRFVYANSIKKTLLTATKEDYIRRFICFRIILVKAPG